MRKLPNIHPGEVLLEEFLTPMARDEFEATKAVRDRAMAEVVLSK
jgi:plasmid maintenance system antidote protein VapI